VARIAELCTVLRPYAGLAAVDAFLEECRADGSGKAV
jgi:hypothetical protein